PITVTAPPTATTEPATAAPTTSVPATATFTSTPQPQTPVAGFTFATADNITYNFTDTSQPAGAITSWSWDFGGLGTSNEQNPSFTFSTNGTYAVKLIVTSAGGTSQPASQLINVTGNVAAPTANFTFTTADNITFNFTDTSQPSGTITSWLWDFGGLANSTEQNPSFTFPANGDYQVSLVVTNSSGTSQPATQTIHVTGNVGAPTASFTVNSADNITFTFTDTSQPTGTITSWLWDFGGQGNSTEQNPSFTFPVNGQYTVALIVTNNAGTSQPATQTINVTGNVAAPNASFNANSFDNITFSFTDTSQPAGTITSWLWDFGGQGNSTEQNPSFAFTTNGDYQVSLIVTNAGGTSQPATQTIHVTGNLGAPTADFSANSFDQVTFNFTDASQPAGTISAWNWDFAGMGTSNEQNPSFTFPANGQYPVTLTVTNAGGTSQPATKTIEVTGVADTPPDDSIADTTAVLPDIQDLAGSLQNIADFDRDPAIYGLAGDNSVKQDGFLKPFGDGDYTLDDGSSGLQATIDTYVASGTFTRNTVALGNDFLVSNLLNDTVDGCNGETLFQCELTQSNGTMVVISVGLRDALNGTDPEAFRNDFDTILQSSIQRGVIP
ncbi:MAG TPA: PKD domain-containing protein, partial [Phototrophicaceae bacterium]|nr:PKD domain-containing protein [Phototrophicaceae bacterium]